MYGVASRVNSRSLLLLDARSADSCTRKRVKNGNGWDENLRLKRGIETEGDGKKTSQAPGTHCTRKSPLPLLPSGPGGFGGSTSRETDA